MEAINSGMLQYGFIYSILKKSFLGSVCFGFLLSALYFSIYLINLYRLPKQSRQYRHQSEYLQTQNILRYIITICCLLVISGLFYFFIQIGEESMHIGAGVWLLYFGYKYVQENYVRNHQIIQKSGKQHMAI